MRASKIAILFMALIVFVSRNSGAAELKIAVIGGLDMSGFWPEMEQIAAQAIGHELRTVLAAPKERVVPAFVRGEVDVLLMHGGDEAFALEALGYAAPLRTWAYNEFVIVGPDTDSAQIATASDGVDAMRKLQAAGAPLISFRDIASQQIIRRLLDSAGLYPRDINLINDRAGHQREILEQAAQDQAYVIVGHMPVAFGRIPGEGTRILLQGDPAMRRGYVVLIPGSKHPANEEIRARAQELSEFLVSDVGQSAISSIGMDEQQWLLPKDSGYSLLPLDTHP